MIPVSQQGAWTSYSDIRGRNHGGGKGGVEQVRDGLPLDSLHRPGVDGTDDGARRCNSREARRTSVTTESAHWYSVHGESRARPLVA